MLWPATLLGAVAGLAVASIPGALLGGLLGQVLDRRWRLHSWAVLRERLGGAPAADDEALLFILLGRLAKCEGRVSQAHIQQARAEMQRLGLHEQAQRRAIEAFARGKTGRDSLRAPLRRQRQRSEALLRACWRMAWVDGRVSQAERELILLWGTWLGVSAAAQELLSSAYAPKQGPLASAGGNYQEALRLLGVAANSEPAQIKRAYRRLVSRHHPDKLLGSGAGPERVRDATEKTRELHQAYALIRQRHGFR
ncbi:TerB family tellurite resistance protein [Pseudomonas sp. UBA2684]|uniref:TerB family tellurite resistance protein n=1 Tax=Pseudomonas sp. UBA2684 TaxID=1947311 RepID=UPI000E9542DF|nr:TerB family tellurite resistance protein [Pseudomonas sp. UBA2684]HBX56960.1 molecular chaperone DjlA [Pseudomonas sp.]|tara:strand:- start:8055 stop:8813 length:759 start_codon:yes stop_codon:yes gene_type:complete